MMYSSPPNSPPHHHNATTTTHHHARSTSSDLPPLPPAAAGISCPAFPLPLHLLSNNSIIDKSDNGVVNENSIPASIMKNEERASLSRRNTVSTSTSSSSGTSCSSTKINKTANLSPNTSSPLLPLLDLSCLTKSSANLTLPPVTSARQQIEEISTTLSCIRPYLYVGSQSSLYDCSFTPSSFPYPLTHIISFVSSETPKIERLYLKDEKPINKLTNCITISFPIRDDVHQCIEHIFLPVTNLIDEVKKSKGAVALVCSQGISRSATCALAYLILREGLSVDQALNDVRKSRPIVAPNNAFMNALNKLHQKIRFGLKMDSVNVVKRATTSSNTNCERQKHQKLLYYGDEKVKYESTTASIRNRQFVALPVSQIQNKDEFNVNKSVIVIEKRQRMGVIIWFGVQSDREIQLAGQRLGRMIAKQQESDANSFYLPESHNNSGIVGNVTVVVQGQHKQIDECIDNAVRSANHFSRVGFDDGS